MAQRQGQGQTDAEVVAALRAGAVAEFDRLVTRHHGLLVRMATIWTRDPGAAEELAQETWIAVIEGIDRFEGRSTLRTWIVGILLNKARTRAKRERRSAAIELSTESGDVPAEDPAQFSRIGRWRAAPGWWDDDTPERLLLEQETLAVIEDAIASLPPGPRAVLVMRDVEGWDSAEVCNALDISATNQRVLLHRARGRLRAVLDQYLERKRTKR